MNSEAAPICSSCGAPLNSTGSDIEASLCTSCLEKKVDLQRKERAIAMLPPTFIVAGENSGTGSSAVELPDASGGTRTLDAQTVRIIHKGQVIELRTWTPEQRKWRRRIINTVAFVIAGALLWLAYRILTM